MVSEQFEQFDVDSAGEKKQNPLIQMDFFELRAPIEMSPDLLRWFQVLSNFHSVASELVSIPKLSLNNFIALFSTICTAFAETLPNSWKPEFENKEKKIKHYILI